jgi:hypothetical protein
MFGLPGFQGIMERRIFAELTLLCRFFPIRLEHPRYACQLELKRIKPDVLSHVLFDVIRPVNK